MFNNAPRLYKVEDIQMVDTFIEIESNKWVLARYAGLYSIKS